GPGRNRIYLAGITSVEVTSAVARRRKGRKITSAKASSILHRFRQHLAGRYTLIDVTPALLTDAMRLANTHSLRAYDAVQLAAALHIRREHHDAGFSPVTLISADQALNAAATARKNAGGGWSRPPAPAELCARQRPLSAIKPRSRGPIQNERFDRDHPPSTQRRHTHPTPRHHRWRPPRPGDRHCRRPRCRVRLGGVLR